MATVRTCDVCGKVIPDGLEAYSFFLLFDSHEEPLDIHKSCAEQVGVELTDPCALTGFRLFLIEAMRAKVSRPTLQDIKQAAETEAAVHEAMGVAPDTLAMAEWLAERGRGVSWSEPDGDYSPFATINPYSLEGFSNQLYRCRDLSHDCNSPDYAAAVRNTYEAVKAAEEKE